MTQHNDHHLSEWFDLWSQDEPLTEAQLASLRSDPIWAERMIIHQQMAELGQQMTKDSQVPDWNRDQGFDQYLAKPSWWQRQGLSLVALSFSIFACLIMLFDVRLATTKHGTQLVKSGQIDQSWLEQQFVQLAEQNYALINQRMDDIKQTQQNDTAQLASYLMTNSRLERKEDIADVIAVIQQQRQDDMRYLRQQFSDVNYNLRLANQRNFRATDFSDNSVEHVTE